MSVVRNLAVYRTTGLCTLVGTIFTVTAFTADLATASDRGGWMSRAWASASTSSTTGVRSGGGSMFDWSTRPSRLGYATLSKERLKPMRAAIKRYAAIVKAGGWKSVPKVEMKIGMSGRAVALLRRRLEKTGDLARSNGDYFNYSVRSAVERFQRRHGLKVTGELMGRNGARTVAALNVPASSRLRQLRMNLRRISALIAKTKRAHKYVLVNIPGAYVEAVTDGKVTSRHAAVVGKVTAPTPSLSSRVHEVNFNPYWHVPPGVRKKVIIEGRKLARYGKTDLVKKWGIRSFVGGWGGREIDPRKVRWNSGMVQGLAFRQDPGPKNMLGFVKINFLNGHAVYLHDTPSKRTFQRNFRAASAGCVRVEGIHNLVTWLLQDNKDWGRSRVLSMKKSGARLDVRLRKSVPIHLAYITAWVSPRGQVSFRRDLYKRDYRAGVSRTASAY